MTTPNTNSTPRTDALDKAIDAESQHMTACGESVSKIIEHALTRLLVSHKSLETELQSALREVEELKRDKERLDWLQAKCPDIWFGCGQWRVGEVIRYGTPPAIWGEFDTVRQAIDNAMKEK